MPWHRALVPAAVALVILSFLAGAGSCGRPPSLQLLRVLDVTPRDVEVGDRVLIAGDGFPAGRPARVTFRGTLHRSGDGDRGSVAILTAGVATSPDRVEMTFDDALQALFAGAGETAVHTTFEGTIEVAFAAAAPGASPVAGALSGVVFDVRPSAGPAERERDAEGERFLAFQGIHAVPGARGNGLFVERIEVGSRAESLGVRAGDSVLRFDGVRVVTPGDMLPRPGERRADVTLSRDGGGERRLAMPIAGFKRGASLDLFAAWLAVLAALTVVLLSSAPLPAPAARVLDRIAVSARLRERSGKAPAASITFARLGKAAFPPPSPLALVDVVAWGLLAVLPFGQYLVAAGLDVGILYLGAATSLATAAALASSTPWRATKTAIGVLAQHVPGAVAAAGVVLTTGSLRVVEVERAQGGMPWEWLAFRSPASLVALFVLASPSLVAVVHERRLGGLSGRAWLAALERAQRVVVAGLAVALFLGGWALPGMSAAQQDSRPVLETLGAFLFLGKVALVVLAMAGARRVLAGTRPRRTALAFVVIFAISLLSLFAARAWSLWGLPDSVQGLASASLVVVTAAAVVGLAHRFVRDATGPGADPHLSPFL